MKQGLGPLSSFSSFLHYPIVMDAEPKNRSMIKQRNIWAKTRWLPWLCPAYYNRACTFKPPSLEQMHVSMSSLFFSDAEVVTVQYD